MGAPKIPIGILAVATYGERTVFADVTTKPFEDDTIVKIVKKFQDQGVSAATIILVVGSVFPRFRDMFVAKALKAGIRNPSVTQPNEVVHGQ